MKTDEKMSNYNQIVRELENQGYTVTNDTIYYIESPTDHPKIVGKIVKDADNYKVVIEDELVIANKKDFIMPYSFIFKGDNIQEKLQKANVHYIEDYKRVLYNSLKYPSKHWDERVPIEKAKAEAGCKIMLWSEWQKQKRESILSKPLKEVTEKEYNDMLNVLPPLHYISRNGITMFCMSEMYTETYTNQYAYDSKNDRYYVKYVDVKDRSTWIDKILSA